MRTLTGLALGVALTLTVLAIWRGPTVWMLTRIPPATPPGHQPRTRIWHHGIEQPSHWPTP